MLLLSLLLFFFVSADFVLGVLVLEGLGVIVCSSATSSYARFSARRIVHWYDAHIMGISNRRVRMSRKAYTHKDDNITRGLLYHCIEHIITTYIYVYAAIVKLHQLEHFI